MSIFILGVLSIFKMGVEFYCSAGTAWSGFGTWKGTAMCPEGQEFVVGQALRPASSLASYPAGADTVLQVIT